MIAVITNSKGDRFLTNRTRANRLSQNFPSRIRALAMYLSDDEEILAASSCRIEGRVNYFLVTRDKNSGEEISRVFIPKYSVKYGTDTPFDYLILSYMGNKQFILLKDTVGSLLREFKFVTEYKTELTKLKREGEIKQLWTKLHYTTK